jgi:4-hydroxy-2-oxoheptanedioate aldolase
MRANPIRGKWQRGETVVNGWIAIPHPFVAETMAHQGWDSLTIDMQHGAVDYQDAFHLLTAISTTQCAPVVRVPWLDPATLMKVLDAGAYGVICPMINSADEAERFVSATTYPPRGERSFGPIRGFLYGGPDYPTQADDTIVRFAMIETQAALDNLDAILAVDGLDAIYVGPADLSRALGCEARFDQEAPVVLEAIDYILARAKAAGKPAGIHNGTAPYARRMVDKGYNFVTIGSDARFIAASSRAVVEEMRQHAERR